MRILLLIIILTFNLSAAEVNDIHNFWFGNDKWALWFGKNEKIDLNIKNRFESTVQKAASGELKEWETTPNGRLALIILLDQMPRNMYRNHPQSFAFDEFAREIALQGILNKEDLKLSPIERAFFYLPFEHAENLALQALSVEKFTQLLEDAPVEEKEDFKSWLDYANKHYDIISRFGRFPHRNQILNRDSTAEEIEFLKEKGSSF